MKKKLLYLLLIMPFCIQHAFAQENDTIYIAIDSISCDQIQKMYYLRHPSEKVVSSSYNDKNCKKIKRKYGDIPYEFCKIEHEKPKYPSIEKKWVSVHQYKGEYVVYKPCETIDIEYLISNDYFIQYFADGPAFDTIQSITKTKDIYKLLVRRTIEENYTVEIIPIDETTGLSIFRTNDIDFELKIPEENAEKLPVIVNECPCTKTQELQFEPIDFEKLLSNLKKE